MHRVSAVAARCGVHDDTVRAWVRRGLIAVVVLPSGQKRVTAAELARILGGRPDEAAAPRDQDREVTDSLIPTPTETTT